MQGVLNKERLAVLALVLTAAPWLRGGRDSASLTVILALIIIGTFLAVRSRGLGRIRLASAGIWYSLIVVWSGLSVIWSVNRYQSLSWFILLALAGLVSALAATIGKDKKLRAYGLKMLVAMASIASAYGLWLFVTGDYDRLTSGFYWANPYAGFLYPTLILLGWRWGQRGGRWVGGLLLLNATAFLLTYSRASLLVFSAVVLLAFVLARPSRKFLARVAGVVILAVGCSLIIGQIRLELSPKHAIINQASRFNEAVHGEATSGSDRINYLRSAVQIWTDHLLLGTGGGTYGTVHTQYQIRVISAGTSAHNAYVQALAELGLIGGILVIGFGLAAFVGLIRTIIHGGIGSALAFATILLLLHLGFEIDTQFPAMIMLTALCIGLCYTAGPIRLRLSMPAAWVSVLAIIVLAQPIYALERSRELADDGAWLQTNGHYDDAADAYHQAHLQLTYNPDTFVGEGINNYISASISPTDANAKLKLAERRARQAIAQDGQDAQHYFLLARVQVALDQVSSAEINYHEALRLDKFNHPEYYDDLVRLLVAHDRATEGLSAASDGLALYADATVLANRGLDMSFASSVSRLYVARADAYLRLRQLPLAKSDLNQALAVDAGNREAGDLIKQLQE